MPVYEFQCRDCGHPVEIIARMQESGHVADQLDSCPTCGHRNFRRVWDAPAIMFVGGGWACKS